MDFGYQLSAISSQLLRKHITRTGTNGVLDEKEGMGLKVIAESKKTERK